MNTGILGGGSWGISLAVLLEGNGHKITLWEFNSSDAAMLREKREHATKLPGIRIPETIEITNDIAAAVENTDVVLVVVPAQTVRATAKKLVSSVSEDRLRKVSAWIVASKGIEHGTGCLIADILEQEIPGASESKVVVLSGPSHAEEVSRGIPTAVVAASEDQELATLVQKEFSTQTFRVYTNNDVTGVELAASVKNVIAVAAGICDGLGFGDNTKGAILTRGIVEMIRLGKKLGADEQTFFGLAGFGDLITTCMSRHSRNRRIGELIGSGLSLEDALGKMTMVAEGVETTRALYEMARQHNVEMPITTEVYRALFEGKSPKEAARDLMTREHKHEFKGSRA